MEKPSCGCQTTAAATPACSLVAASAEYRTPDTMFFRILTKSPANKTFKTRTWACSGLAGLVHRLVVFRLPGG